MDIGFSTSFRYVPQTGQKDYSLWRLAPGLQNNKLAREIRYFANLSTKMLQLRADLDGLSDSAAFNVAQDTASVMNRIKQVGIVDTLKSHVKIDISDVSALLRGSRFDQSR